MSGQTFFGDNTPWYCAACGYEIKRGEEMMAYYDDEKNRVEVHKRCPTAERYVVTIEVDADGANGTNPQAIRDAARSALDGERPDSRVTIELKRARAHPAVSPQEPE